MTKRIGRYEILAEIGHGGFGRVFRGLDPTVGRHVAIKTLIADDDAGMLTRFRNEAAASGRLRHPNIVTIFDFGEHESVPFIVMELLEGHDLLYAIEDPARTPLSLLQKIQIMTQIASGLGHAHAGGIIHRDVKPANVMLLNDGGVKIMDFGIALVTQGTQSRVTPRGAMIGTFRYMAPEQFKGAEPDARSDIFSYGLIFYELLAGVHPFHAVDAAALMYNILSVDPVPIGDVSRDIPPELQAVVARLLLKDPDTRYQSLDDVVFDLQPALMVLRTSRAHELLQEASAAKQQQQFETAQGLIRQALELSPGHADARQLREEVQAELRRQAIRPRLENLLQKGREALAAGNPEEAIQQFESAIRLDPVSAQSISLLQQARAAAERSRETARLAGEAENALRGGDLAAAVRLARQALAMSPDDAAAQLILQRADAALAEEQRKTRLSDALSRTRRLIEIRSWNEASDLLSALAVEFPDIPEIAGFDEEIRAGRIEDERERQLASGLAEARQNIQKGNLALALATLEELAKSFGGSKDVKSLRRFVASEIEEKRRRDTVQQSIEQAHAFAARHDLEGARKALEKGLAEYPAEAGLQQELRGILAEQKEATRRRALEQAVALAEKSRAERHLEHAIATLDRFVDEHGADPAIEKLRDDIFKDGEAARRTEELRDFIHRATDLLAQGQPEAAVTLLHAPPEHFKGHPEITRLLNAADIERKAREDRKAAIDEALSAAAILGKQGRAEQGLARLNAFKSRYGDDPRIDEARQALERARQEVQRAATELAQRATALIPKDPFSATALLSNAPTHLREHPAVQAAGMAAAKAEEERQSRLQVEDLLAQARALAAQADFAGALRILEDGLKSFPANAGIVAARTEVAAAIQQKEREELRRVTLAQVHELLERDRLGEAELAIMSILVGNPDDQEFQQLRRDVEARQNRRTAELAEQEIQEALGKAREILEQKPAEAVASLDRLARKYPDRPDISSLLTQAWDVVAARERRDLIERAERLCERQDFDNALATLSAASADSGGEIAAAIAHVRLLHLEADKRSVARNIQSAREIRDRDPHAAQKLLEKIPQALRQRTQLASEVEAEIEACRALIVRAERASALAEIEQLAASGKLSKARARHKAAVSKFGGDAELTALLERIEQSARPKPAQTAPAESISVGASPTGPRPFSKKPIWVAASIAAAAIVFGGIWSITHQTPELPPVVESPGNPAAAPEAVNLPPAAPPTKGSPAKGSPATPPSAQATSKSPVASANPVPAGKSEPVRPEPKQVAPPQAEPDQPRQNKDKAETTVAVLPPQPSVTPPANNPAPVVAPLPGPATPPAVPPATSPGAGAIATKAPPPSEAPAIEQVLADFGAAFTRKDINVVSALWPSMPNLSDYRKSFGDKNFVVRRYALDPQSPPNIQDERATVTVRLTSEIAYQRGGGVVGGIPSIKTVLLEKRSGKWVITGLR